MNPTESALIVAVPEAEPVVGRHRRDLDHSAPWGVPAHVTVLYPFVPPARIDPGTIETVRAVVRRGRHPTWHAGGNTWSTWKATLKPAGTRRVIGRRCFPGRAAQVASASE